jgi:hypothetical protein
MRTIYLPHALDADRCTASYDYLASNIQWDDGVPSRTKGFTRFAKAMNLGEDSVVTDLVTDGLKAVGGDWDVIGLYLNYYLDGSNWTPTHSHKGTAQLIISLGATRTLTLAKKDFALANGDVMLFGAGIHSIPLAPDVKDGRISIATFMVPT